MRVVYKGAGGHAGAVLMRDRNDSLLAGAELALAVEHAALTIGGADTVATAGVLDVHPRAINSIPSQVKLEIDIRDVELVRRDNVLSEIQRRAAQIGTRRNQATSIERINADPPASCDAKIVDAIIASCQEAGLTYKKMISRAYHDSLFMALVAPTSMIFIACRGGVSHRPDEFASPEALAAGVEVLALTLARLAEGDGNALPNL
jgi:N-carbamoyl-L-amino-acid hydrolase